MLRERAGAMEHLSQDVVGGKLTTGHEHFTCWRVLLEISTGLLGIEYGIVLGPIVSCSASRDFSC